jgi:hypothetical protein
VVAAVAAQFEGDDGELAWCAAQLAAEAGPSASAAPTGRSAAATGAVTAGVPGWQQIAGRKLWQMLLRDVTAAWHRGWQPAEVIRHVERQSGPRHARVATDAVAAEMRGYAAATVDGRWTAQLAALGAAPWWDHDDSYLAQWGARERIDLASRRGARNPRNSGLRRPDHSG